MWGNLRSLQCVPMVQNISKIHFKLTDFLHDPSVVKKFSPSLFPNSSLFFFFSLFCFLQIFDLLMNNKNNTNKLQCNV